LRCVKPSRFERAGFGATPDGEPKEGNASWRRRGEEAVPPLQIPNLRVMRFIFPAIDLLNRAT
jgi:hypothetical protein